MTSTTTYTFAVISLFLLCLAPLSFSEPPDCEDLTRPVDRLDPGYFEGRWAFVAGSLGHSASMEALRLRDSITAFFTNSSDTSASSYVQVNRFGDACRYLPYNISVHSGGFTFDVGNRFDLMGHFLHAPCPDCMVMRWDVKSSRRTSVDLYLLSKRRNMEQEEMEVFKAQLRCSGLPEPVVMDPTKELCPENP